MISLKKTIEAYDHRSMSQAALESFVSALESLEKNTIAVDHEGLNSYRSSLAALKERMETTTLSPPVLRELALDLDAQLKRYRTEVEGLLKENSHDLKDVVAVLAEATESLSQRENLHGNQLSRISGNLEAISQIDNLAIVRVTLNRQVNELRTCISNMARDNESALAGLQKEIANFQQRLEKVQIEAATDPLTALANRRRCTREIGARIRSRIPFGILLFDLNNFKAVNDTLGHAAGDSVLQSFSHRLLELARPNDVVCRWGGDEFVVVQDGRPDELAASGKEILGRFSGKFAVKANGKEHEVAVGAEFGWAAYAEGESPEELFAKADQLLYTKKSPKQLPPAPPTPGPSTPAPAPVEDPTTGLFQIDALECELAKLNGDLSAWFVGCFAIRSAAKVNSHYGYPATDSVLPVLRDEILASKLGARLFRGPGAAILALLRLPGGPEAAQAEIDRITSLGFEKNVRQKRRASVLPVTVGVALLPAADDVIRKANAFIDMQRAGARTAFTAGSSRNL